MVIIAMGSTATGARPVDKGIASHFSAWIDPLTKQRKPTVLVGAGMSYGLAPLANDLGKMVGTNQRAIELELGVGGATKPVDAPSLYRWATECLVQLGTRGLAPLKAKKKLADAMGLTRDPYFLAKANIHPRGTTDRHRVLGRLCREGQVHAIWSFNWDCWLESAFRAVGLHATEVTGLHAPKDWCTSYHVWYEGSKRTVSTDVVQLFKAHGCLSALDSGHGDFIISDTEMSAVLDSQSKPRIARMEADLQEHPVVCLGWGASEPYIRELFSRLANSALLGDSMTVVDINVAQPWLLEVQDVYTDPALRNSVQLNGSSPGTADELFLWIQARRGIACIKEACGDYPSVAEQIELLGQSIPDFDSVNLRAHWQVQFLDSWLPVWLRTCYMVMAQTHRPAESQSLLLLPTEERDSHIPWVPASYRRDDLLSAATLFVELAGQVDMDAWEFEKLPGAIWNPSTQVAILPVPAWTEDSAISARSLKPLLESRHWVHKAKIKSCVLLTLDSPALSPRGADEIAIRNVRWAEAISKEFRYRHLANPANYRVINLSELSDVSKE